MGKQSRSKRADSIGKGKVTPVQVAFIVDRYLSDNNFSETRSVFRTEASSLISKSPVQEAPKSLLSLGAILNEYISLKEKKVMVDQEGVRLEQEKLRVQNLLMGMQHVLNAYNSSAPASASASAAAAAAESIPAVLSPPSNPAVAVPQHPRPIPFNGSLFSGCHVSKSPVFMPISTPSNSVVRNGNMTSNITIRPLSRKRLASDVVSEAPQAAKKPISKFPPRKMPTKGSHKPLDNAASTQEPVHLSSLIGSSPHYRTSAGSLGSSVAKSLFVQPSLSPPTSSSGPNTPPQGVSSQNDKSATPVAVSSQANCSNNSTPRDITPSNCTVITSERVTVSPCKHVSYYMERNQCVLSSSPVKTPLKRLSKRDNVKGRLDFDASDVTVRTDKPTVEEISTSESDKEVDLFDIDLPNIDFSFSELLGDLDLDCKGEGCPCLPVFDASADNVSGSSHESGDGNRGADQALSEFSSTVTQVISEKDMQTQGPDTRTAVKSVTKCIRILSPVKIQKRCFDPENSC